MFLVLLVKAICIVYIYVNTSKAWAAITLAGLGIFAGLRYRGRFSLRSNCSAPCRRGSSLHRESPGQLLFFFPQSFPAGSRRSKHRRHRWEGAGPIYPGRVDSASQDMHCDRASGRGAGSDGVLDIDTVNDRNAVIWSVRAQSIYSIDSQW